jgi:hypothetical protein
MIAALLREPPVRRLVKLLVRRLPFSLSTKSLWDAVDRPHYLFGILYAARRARLEGHSSVTIVEFGVAEGDGLLTLQHYAARVERMTGIEIHVAGFDTGDGLPALTDYRDHPDQWRSGDYRMDVARLRAQLSGRTTLYLGDVHGTAQTTVLKAPIGFMAMDLDLYTSTAAALRILCRPDQPKLRRVALYFDDLDEEHNHRFAGELLAIDEFNAESKGVKIDRWRGLAARPFPDAAWLRSMYLAHDLTAISQVTLTRPPARMR